MEEKKIIESVNSYKKAVLKIVIASLIIALCGLYICIVSNGIRRNSSRQLVNKTYKYTYAYSKEKIQEVEDALYAKRDVANSLSKVGEVVAIVSAAIFVIMLIFYCYVNGMQIIVTNKRVYGRTAFGKQVDLPLDSISAVGTSLFKGIAVATSSGSIRFLGISNRDDIHEAISCLLVKRQTQSKPETVYQEKQSSADELKKYKDLLDSGVISQEEFDAKKKQLLGL